MVQDLEERRRQAANTLPLWLGTAQSIRLGVLIFAGLLVIALFFGGVGAWAVFAPLDSAAIATGVIGVETRRKVVQHLEGGIVRDVLVREGDRVSDDQPLVVLDDTQIRTKLDMLKGRYRAALARRARLVAQRDRRDTVPFPEWLVYEALKNAEAEAILLGQRQIFDAQRESVASQSAILRQRIQGHREEFSGLEAQIEAADRQLALIARETEAVKILVDKGLTPKPRLYALQRKSAEIAGSRARNRALIARGQQQVAEIELQILNLEIAMRDEVLRELQQAGSEIADLTDRIDGAADVLRRTVILAPAAGTIVGLQVYTVGQVLAPGDIVLEIVPSGDSLIVEARIDPTDIDVVHRGLNAQVRLTAFPFRSTPMLEGRVTHVSADRLVDEQSGQGYFGAKIVLEEPGTKVEELTLYPGMTAEVFILTGRSTALEYILDPITRTLSRAMREM